MQQAPSIAQVQHAVSALYRGSANREEHDWLTEFQKSPFAWNLAREVTSGKGLPDGGEEEFAFFAANTLVQKCKRDILQLSFDDRPLVRDELLRNVSSRTLKPADGSDGLGVAEKYLCLALALFTINAPESGGVTFLFAEGVIQQLPVEVAVQVALMIAEELSNATISTLRKDAFLKDMRAVVGVVGSIVQNNLSSQSVKGKIAALRCFQQWAPYGLLPADERFVPVFQLALECLGAPSTLAEAAECLSEVVSARGHSEQSLMACSVLSVQKLASQEVQALLHSGAGGEEFGAIAHLGSAVALANISELFQDSNLITPLAELMLVCTEHEDKKVAETALDFWEASQEVQLNMRPEHLAKPLMEKLINALLRSISFPEDFTTWDESIIDEDEFERYRRGVRDLCLGISSDLGSSSLDVPFASLQPNVAWNIAEAALFLIGAMGGELQPSRTSVLKRQLNEDEQLVLGRVTALLEMVSNAGGTALNHPRVRMSALSVVNGFISWVKLAPQLLEPILQFVVTSLHVDLCFKTAAKSFLSACAASSSQLAKSDPPSPMIPQLIAVVGDAAFVKEDTAPRAMLLEGVSRVIGELEQEHLMAVLGSVFDPICDRMSKIAAECSQHNVDMQNDKEPLVIALTAELKICAAAVKYLEKKDMQPHPVAVTLEKLWPTFEFLKQKQLGDELVGAASTALSSALRAGKQSLLPFISPILQACSDLFANTNNHNVLQVFAVAVEVFGETEGGVEAFSSLLHVLVPKVTTILQQHGTGAFSDLIESFFGMLHRYLLFCPDALLPQPDFHSVVQLAVSVMRYERARATVASTVFFLSRFLSPLNRQGAVPERYRSHVDGLLGNLGGDLVASLLEGLINVHGMDIVHRIGECLLSLSERIPPQVQGMFASFLDGHPGVAALNLTYEQKEKLIVLTTQFRDHIRYRALISDVAKILRGEQQIDALVAYEM